MKGNVMFVFESPADAASVVAGFLQILPREDSDVKVNWAGDLLADWGKDKPGYRAAITVSSRDKKKLENYLIGARIKFIIKSTKELNVQTREYNWVYFLGMSKEQVLELLKDYYQALMYSWKIEKKLDWSSIAEQWAFTVPGQIEERTRFHKYLAKTSEMKRLHYEEKRDPNLEIDYVEVSLIKNK